MRVLINTLFFMLSTQAFSEPFKDELLAVKAQHRVALLSLLKNYDSSCREEQS